MSKSYEALKQAVEDAKYHLNYYHTMLKELLAQCTHEELEPKEMYFEGSYYDRAHTDYWDECKLCGKRFNQRTKEHSWYG